MSARHALRRRRKDVEEGKDRRKRPRGEGPLTTVMDVPRTGEDIKQAFEVIRTTRRKYLHLWSQDHTTLPADAVAVYHAAVSIVVRAIGQDFEAGKIRLNPALVEYLEKSGVLEVPKEGE